ncbi:MAG: hypothetical protein FJ026_04430 [Chloroflexi bacterium]|nr:hypothetical protein [Chloroflexota bacterium]
MHNQSKWVLVLSAVLFSVGFLLGLAFTIANVWADFEAVLFDPSVGAEAALSSLRCPVLITPQESGTVVATFSNPSELALLRTVRAHISHGFATLMREESERFVLEPGQSRQVVWTVTAADAAWRHFILVRVHELRNYPLPSRTGSCGILVVNVSGLTGNQIVALTAATAVLSMAVSVVLWMAGRRASSGPIPDLTRNMVLLAAIVLAAMLISFTGRWLAGGLLAIVVVLLAVTMTAWAASRATI